MFSLYVYHTVVLPLNWEVSKVLKAQEQSVSGTSTLSCFPGSPQGWNTAGPSLLMTWILKELYSSVQPQSLNKTLVFQNILALYLIWEYLIILGISIFWVLGTIW